MYDGTNATKIDINVGAGSSDPYELTDVGGTLYFNAFDGTDRELWKYDGRNATKIDINPGTGSSYPEYLTDVGGTLYFCVRVRRHGPRTVEVRRPDRHQGRHLPRHRDFLSSRPDRRERDALFQRV